jgi:hypothetical protein
MLQYVLATSPNGRAADDGRQQSISVGISPFWKINADPYRQRRLIGFRRIAPILANSGLFFWGFTSHIVISPHFQCDVILFTVQ